MTTLKSQPYQSTRLTLSTSNPISHVLQKLYSSIGDPSKVDEWKRVAKNITSYSSDSKAQFEAEINKSVGLHGFMIFQEFDHGSWIPLYGVGDGLKCKRIILGNPLIAITMLKHDVTAGLAVPVEILVREVEEGGTEVMWNLPSALIAGVEGEWGLMEAARKLDGKLEELGRWICE